MNMHMNWAEIASVLLQFGGVAVLFAVAAYGLFRYAAQRDAERESRGETVERSLAPYASRRTA